MSTRSICRTRRAPFALLCTTILVSSLTGCGNATVQSNPSDGDDRDTLPSGIIDGDTGGDLLDPAGIDPAEDFSGYEISAVPDKNSQGTWDLAIKSRTPDRRSLRFEWDLGTGQVLTGSTQHLVLDTPGTYTIKVSAYDNKDNLAFTLSLDLEVPPPGEPPVAKAGADQSVLGGDVVLLDGSGSSDPDDNALAFIWSQTGSNSPVSLSNAFSSKASFVAPDVASDTMYQFTLTVSDGINSSQDIVFVEVLAGLGGASVGPFADAGLDLDVQAGASVTLDGTGSSGSGASALTFAWSQALGTNVTLGDPTALVVSFTAPTVAQTEDLIFTLTVTEGNLSSSDDIVVTVQPTTTTSGGGGGGTSGGGGGTGGGTTPPTDNCPNDSNKTDPGQCGCGVPDTDGDGDGTADCNDGCPADSNKSSPGICGCGQPDTDGDNDGTPDCNDACPADPNKTAAGSCGCGVADADSDGDGTPDCNDGCPNDPAKTSPGNCGCGLLETDSDSDGTPNCNDGCPNDGNKTAPGSCGCGVADTDSDSDGTANCLDACPNDANKTALGICGCGVSDIDSDLDGVADCNDQCPGQADVDSDGDGTLNCNDGCPNDPAKTAPGQCGCGFADLDTNSNGVPDCNEACPPGQNGDADGDGVLDCVDACPNDAGKVVPGVCGCGTADVDSDSDLVPDCIDQCPGQPDMDSDGDGVVNCNDGCPNDPNKTIAGSCGCGVADTDSDNDGTADCNDGCPNDANKTAPGTCGCGTADTDSDSDGTPNCNDGCNNDPNKTAPGICGCGTSDVDSDNDGTVDCNDGCPNDANKTASGVCGCGTADTDSDSDGTPNCNDGCANDPNKTSAGVCGCGTADTDSDSDGTPNCNDGCPNDVNKTAAGVCGCGTADVDLNSDGIIDCTVTGCTNNTLVESSFENNGAGWQFTSSGGRSIVTTEAHTGNASQQMVVSTQWSRQVDQVVAVTGSLDYTVSEWLKLSGVNGVGASIEIDWLDAASGVVRTDTIGPVSGTQTWTQLTGNMTAPASATTARLQLMMAKDLDGVGTAWIDDVSFCPNGTDTDGDGVFDSLDLDPNNPNICGDTDGDSCDDCTSGTKNTANDGPDADGDGVCDAGDVCPGFDDTIDTNSNGTPDGCEPPKLCVGTTALNFGLVTGQIPLLVWNCGGGSLGYTIADDAAWLTVSPTSGSSSGEQDTITATVDRTGLATNTYQGDITVTPTVGAAIKIAVAMTVAQTGGGPTISITTSRNSGVSPLGVFFDASATTSATTNRPFHVLDYTWDFGDPGSIFVTRPGVDANRAKAPMAAHVFEVPSVCSGSGAACDTSLDCPSGQTCGVSKTYTVTLTVRDATGATSQSQKTITVNPFPDTGTTYFVSDSTGSDTNSGLTKSAAFKTWDKAHTMLFLANGPRRILFKRGDVFIESTVNGSVGSKTGPYVIGAYGSGPKPIIRTTVYTTTLNMHAPSTRDLRTVDIHFDGPFGTSQSGNGLTAGSDFLFYRTVIEDHFHGIIGGGGTTTGTMVVDTEILDSENYGIYYSASGTNLPPSHIAVLACVFDGVDREHLIRTYITKSLISQCIFRNGDSVKTNLAYKAPGTTPQLQSNYSVLSSNQFLSPNASLTIMAVGPENPGSAQLVENVIIERNVWDAGVNNPAIDAIQSNGANDVTVRNNVFINARSWIVMSGPVQGFSTWNDWQVYNNSGYRSINNDTFTIRALDNRGPVVAKNLVVRNNIAYVPNSTTFVRILRAPDTPPSDITMTNNIWHFPNQANQTLFEVNGTNYNFAGWQGIGKDSASNMLDPRYVAPNSGNLQLRVSSPTSPGLDGGVVVPSVYEDHRGLPRPTSGFDIGAYEMN